MRLMDGVTMTKAGIRVYKIVLLGEGGVGKSALTLQFVTHSFLDYHDPTIEDAYEQRAVIDGEVGILDILDTAGQVEFTAMRDQYMRGGEGFIICYSITDRRSFQEAAEYKRVIERVRCTDNLPIVLVGNKCDLESQRVAKCDDLFISYPGRLEDSEKHLEILNEGLVVKYECCGIWVPKVSSEEGQGLAREFGCPFFETSAALRHYVDDVFYTMVREIRRKERMDLMEGQKRSRKKDPSSSKFNSLVRKVFRSKKSGAS